MTDVTVVTCKKYFHNKEGNAYINNIHLEYNLLKDALEALGLTVKRTYWNNPEYDWSQTKVAVIRTVWDYFEQFEAFNTWMVKTASVTNLINPLALQQWNSHKFYLNELQEKGIRIVPTEFVAKGTNVSLQEISVKRGWDKKVMKPAISAAAFHTYKVPEANSLEMENTFQALLQEKDMLVQPFIETITDKGEASLMVFNGTYTHAILKKAKEGDFRVQDDFGGSVHPYNPSKEEIEFALAANASCAVTPIYGRVDIVWDAAGNPMLSEMEFLDPEIWIRKAPETAHELAGGIAKMIY
jgi:glutathione synthase/RimK-type ligase-like ATP-grasp enzyme